MSVGVWRFMWSLYLPQIHDMNSQYTLATQKQMRLDSAFAQQRTEVGGCTPWAAGGTGGLWLEGLTFGGLGAETRPSRSPH